MADKTEPLSDPFKELLRSTGIDPGKFNEQITARKLMKQVRGRHSTSRFINSEYYNAVNRKELIGTIAQRLQAQTPRVYLPIAYVMFIRKAHCNNCHTESTCMDSPGLYLMQTDKLGSSTRVFVPVAGVDFPNLPHWTKDVAVKVPYCLGCYEEKAVPSPETDGPQLGPSTPTAGDAEQQVAATVATTPAPVGPV